MRGFDTHNYVTQNSSYERIFKTHLRGVRVRRVRVCRDEEAPEDVGPVGVGRGAGAAA